MNANTTTIENIIDQLDVQYRLSPYLKLRGTVAYRAAKLAGMVLTKQAKLTREAFGGTFDEVMRTSPIDVINTHDSIERGEFDEAELLGEMGLGVSDMYDQLKAMVMYSNKLNFDMLELVDPSGKRRMEPGAKFTGVYHTDRTQRESWLSSARLHAEAKDEIETATYAEYVGKIDDERFVISEEQWNALQADDSASLFETYAEQIVDLIIGVGDDECEFDDLPIRTQIGLIESMRGKLDSIKESCVKSVKYSRLDKAAKIAEASKLVGLIGGMDRQLCDMLDSSRYANYAEFMYSYVPNAGEVQASQVKARRVIVKAQPVGRVSDRMAQFENGATRDELEDFGDLESVLPVSALPNVI